MHFSDGSAMEFETLDRELIKDRKFEPVRPDWFVELKCENTGARANRANRAKRSKKKRRRRCKSKSKPTQRSNKQFIAEADAQIRTFSEIKAQAAERPIEYMTPITELFATHQRRAVGNRGGGANLPMRGNLGENGRIVTRSRCRRSRASARRVPKRLPRHLS